MTARTMPLPPMRIPQPATRQALGQVTVHAVEESALPELDDDFYDQFNVAAVEDVDRAEQFRADVRERLTVELGNALREAQGREALTVLARSHQFELPKAMLEAEMARQGERLGQMLNEVPDGMAQLVAALAENHVRTQLAVGKLVTAEGLTPDDQRIRDRIDEVASAYEESAQVRSAIYADENQLAAIESKVLEEQVVDHILAHARIEDVPTTYAEALNGQALPPRTEAEPETPAQVETETDAVPETDAVAEIAEADAPEVEEPVAAPEESVPTDAPEEPPDDTPEDKGTEAEAGPGLGARLRRMFGRSAKPDAE